MLDITRAYGLTFLFPESDRGVGASLRIYGEFARPEVDFIIDQMSRAPEEATFIDVGANIGSVALPVAAAYPRCKVIGIEAHRGLSGVLAANALNNRLYNVDVVQAAAGPRPGLARFTTAPLTGAKNFGMFGIGAVGPTEHVRLCALDEIAPNNTAVVKIDVEGLEVEVLQGASRLIDTVRPVWIIEANNHDKALVYEVIRILRAGAYKLHWLYAPFATPGSPKPAPGAPKRTGDHNIVAFPEDGDDRWKLPPVEDSPTPAWIDRVSAFTYLERYGFQFAK